MIMTEPEEQQSDQQNTLLPAVRLAPLGELRAYMISEEELNELERGSPATLYMNFGLPLIFSGLSFLATLLATPIPSIRVFTVFVVVAVVFLLAGFILLGIWLRHRSSSKHLAKRIRERMPRASGIHEPEK